MSEPVRTVLLAFLLIVLCGIGFALSFFLLGAPKRMTWVAPPIEPVFNTPTSGLFMFGLLKKTASNTLSFETQDPLTGTTRTLLVSFDDKLSVTVDDGSSIPVETFFSTHLGQVAARTYIDFSNGRLFIRSIREYSDTHII